MSILTSSGILISNKDYYMLSIIRPTNMLMLRKGQGYPENSDLDFAIKGISNRYALIESELLIEIYKLSGRVF